MSKKKLKVKGCACYGVNSIHPCFCSPFTNKKQQVKMEATANEIRTVKKMIMDGNSHDKIAKYLGTTINRISGIMNHLTNENVEMSFFVTLERVKQIEKEMFEAIDNYHANKTLCNLDKVNNLQSIYSRVCSI